jgi:hypothetical protein
MGGSSTDVDIRSVRCGVAGLRNDTEHGADPQTPRPSGPFVVSIALSTNFHRTKGFPLVTRWKIYSPQLLLIRNAGSLTPKLTYPRLSSKSRNRKSVEITHSRNTGSMARSALLEFIGKLVGFFSLRVFSQFNLERCRSSQAHPFSFMLLSFHQPGTA